jgi:hypothetical protein
MAFCSKDSKIDFLNNIDAKTATEEEMLTFVRMCYPSWMTKPHPYKIATSDRVHYLIPKFEFFSNPDTFDNFEVVWKKKQRIKNERKFSKCHGWKLNEEFRFNETCCRCRSSTIEEDDLEQNRLSNSQVCSKCHTRKHFNDFKTTKKGKIYKTCAGCCSK